MSRSIVPVRRIEALVGDVLPPSRRPAQETGHRPGVSSRYAGAETSSFLFGWNPAVREPMEDTIESWVEVTAKVIDGMHNSGWLAGGIDQATSSMIGTHLAINSKPDPALFGGDEIAAAQWARTAERRFEGWARDPYQCDLGGRYTLGQLANQGVKQYFGSGETIATLPFVKRPGNSHGLKVNIMPSSRLAQYTAGLVIPTTGPAANIGRRVVQGVVLGDHGEPVGYVFWNRQSGWWNTVAQEVVAARDADGRPAVLHLLDNAPQAVRGISPLAPALKVVRQLDQLADATLTAALIQTIFAATIQSSDPTADVMKALQDDDEQNVDDIEGAHPGDFDRFMGARSDWYKNTKIDMGRFGKVAHMFPGEELKMNRSEHPNNNYEAMTKVLLREIMRAIGITYEEGTGDYSGATYSSVRMGSANTWATTLYRRSFGPARLYANVWARWLEEDIVNGNTTVPGGLANFRANQQAFCHADFRGPSKPTADDLKTAKAQQIMRAEGWLTFEQICAEYGNDWRENYDQLAKEAAYRETKDGAIPPPPSLGGGMGGLGGGPGDVNGDDDDDEDGDKGEKGSGKGGGPTPGRRGKPSNRRGLDEERARQEAVDRDARLTTALMNDDEPEVQRLLREEFHGRAS